MARMQSNSPTRKVAFTGVAGAATTIIVWVLNSYIIPSGSPAIPAEIAAALTTVIGFVVGYLTPPDPNDQVVIDPPR